MISDMMDFSGNGGSTKLKCYPVGAFGDTIIKHNAKHSGAEKSPIATK